MFESVDGRTDGTCLKNGFMWQFFVIMVVMGQIICHTNPFLPPKPFFMWQKHKFKSLTE